MSETTGTKEARAYRGSLRGALKGIARKPKEKLVLKHFVDPYLMPELVTVMNSSLAGLRGAIPGGLTRLALPPMAVAKTQLALWAEPNNPPGYADLDLKDGFLSLKSMAAQLGYGCGSWNYFTGPRCEWGRALLELHPPEPIAIDGKVVDWRVPPVLAWGFLYLVDRRWARIWHHTLTADPKGPQLQAGDLRIVFNGTRTHPLERPDASGALVGPRKQLLGALECLDANGPYEAEQLLPWQETGGRVALIGDLVVESIAFGD